MGGYKSKNALYVVVKNREKRVTGGGRQEIDVRQLERYGVSKVWEWRLFFRYLLYFFYMCKGGAWRARTCSLA